MKKCYLRDKNGHPVTLIAYEIADGVITYGMSTCHPKDVFDKAKGHLIAENRVKSRKAHAVCQEHENPIIDIAMDIRRHCTYMSRRETLWCGAAKHYLENLTPNRGVQKQVAKAARAARSGCTGVVQVCPKPWPRLPVSREIPDFDCIELTGTCLDYWYMVPLDPATCCKHGAGACETCGTTDKRDTKHTTVGGRGRVARIPNRRA